MQVPVLQVSEVSYAYPNGSSEYILQDVSLTVNSGDYLAILGPNGGGKTTLIKCILGLLSPQKGSVQVFGDLPSKALARIGYVPQYSTARDAFPISVLDVVIMGAVEQATSAFCGLWRKSSANVEKAREALHKVGLERHENKKLCDLSGGQRQRAIVARALMADPKLLLLDEPTANIDPQGKFCFYEFLADLPNEITTIVVSHDLSIAASPFSGIALVNKTLEYREGSTLTPEILSMLYGKHEPTCPMGNFINNVSSMFPDVGAIAPELPENHIHMHTLPLSKEGDA